MIPEFIGRMPVVAVLDPLDEAALIDILVRPRNAVTKQYQKLFQSTKDVDLNFHRQSFESAVAQTALKRKTGARGLRSVSSGKRDAG